MKVDNEKGALLINGTPPRNKAAILDMAAAMTPATTPNGKNSGPRGEKTSAPKAMARGKGISPAVMPPATSPFRFVRSFEAIET